MAHYSQSMDSLSQNLFVYGSLMPGELGYEQIKNLVANSQEAELRGYSLYVRDGLPLIGPSDPWEAVPGILLSVSTETLDEFWNVVVNYEGTTNYRRDDAVKVSLPDQEIVASTFVAKKIARGNPERHSGRWTSKADPLFSRAFPLVHENIGMKALRFTDAEHDARGYWEQMNLVLSQYLMLVGILEHLCVVKFGGSKSQEIMQRIRKLQESAGFQESYKEISGERFNPPIRVVDSRDVATSLSSEKEHQALFAWYQVRSNLQHRGKASLFDAELVQKSSIGLSNFMVHYLRSNIPGINEEWENFLQKPIHFKEFKAR